MGDKASSKSSKYHDDFAPIGLMKTHSSVSSTQAAMQMKMTTTSLQPQYYTLMVHSVSRSTADVIFSPDLLRDYYSSHESDPNKSTKGTHYVQILAEAQVHDDIMIQRRDRLILKVPEKVNMDDSTIDDARVRLEISISSTLAESFGLVPFGRVLLQSVPSPDVEMSFVELVFKRQYLQ